MQHKGHGTGLDTCRRRSRLVGPGLEVFTLATDVLGHFGCLFLKIKWDQGITKVLCSFKFSL